MQTKKFVFRLIDTISKIKSFLIAISFSPWLIILYVIISTYAKNITSNDLLIIQSFIEWFGTAYSLFLALVLVNVWNQFNTIDREFDREVDALTTLYQTANYAQTLNNNRENDLIKIRNSLFEEIEKYLRHVIINYQNEHIIIQQRRKGEEILENIGSSISSLSSEGIIIDPLCTELFRSLNEARDGRGDRISYSKQHIPQTVWLVAIISSLVWLLPFFALNIENLFVKGFLVSGVAFVIVIFLIIIYDFDGPFDGTWKVSIDSWKDFLEVFDPNPQIIFIFKYNNWINDFLSRTFIGKRLKLSTCKLSVLSREGFFGSPWTKFIREIQRLHSNKIKETKCDIFYLDDYNLQGYELNLGTNDLPIVLLRVGNNSIKLIENEEILRCASLKEFIELFYKKIKLQVIDFEQWSQKESI